MTVQPANVRQWPPDVTDRETALRFLVRLAVGEEPGEAEDRAVSLYRPVNAEGRRVRLVLEAAEVLRAVWEAGLVDRWDRARVLIGVPTWSAELYEVLVEVRDSAAGTELVSVAQSAPGGGLDGREVDCDVALGLIAAASAVEWQDGPLNHDLRVVTADRRMLLFGVKAPFGYGPVRL